MARVVVTGGAGFIGSHLVERLVEAGHVVGVIDDLSTGRPGNLQAIREGRNLPITLHRLDLARDDLSTAFDPVPEVVLHLAGQMDVRRSVADPVHDAMVNVIGTIRLLESCRHSGVGKVVFTSSGGCIYGEPGPEDLPVTEDHPGHPHSPYGASKRGAEEYLHTYAALYGLRWTCLALGNVYGRRQDPAGEAGVVAILGGAMLRQEPVTIFGDGEQTRDFVHVRDVVDALLSAMDQGDGVRCNVGSGKAVSVNELFRLLAELTGYRAAPVYAPARRGELEHIALDVRRAAEELGWRPTTPLREGLRETLDWVEGQAEPGTTPSSVAERLNAPPGRQRP